MAEEEFVLDLNKMKIADLKRELQLRGQKVSGNKQDLIQRLQQYLEEHEGAEVEDDDAAIFEEEEEEGEAVEEENEEKLEEESDPPEKEDLAPAVEEEEQKNPLEEEKTVTEVKLSKDMTEEEKKAARAKKFGLKANELSDAARLENRSKRFGTQSACGSGSVDTAKLKSRAERFGVVVSETLSKTDQEEKKLKRQQRFGGVHKGLDNASEEKKRKRAERFGISVA